MKKRRVDLISRREEKETIKRITYFSVFSLILAILLFTVGIPLLGKFADFLDVVFNKKAEIAALDKTLPAAPRLDNLPEATNSAKLVVSGFTQDGTKVFVYLNGDKVGNATVEGSSFKYDGLSLKDGLNEITAKANQNGKESDFSKTEKVAFSTKEPKLEIITPAEGQSYSGDNRIRVTGVTDKDTQVYANGFLANTNANGNFDVFVRLNDGDNTIEIKAVDSAGNIKTEQRKVHFSK